MTYQDPSGRVGYPPSRDAAYPQDPHDPRGPQHPLDPGGPQHLHDPRGPQHPHDPRGPPQPQDPRDPPHPRGPPHPQDPRDPPPPESQYPPPPGEEDDRPRDYYDYHHLASSNGNNVNLPPISPYDNQYGQPQPTGYGPLPTQHHQPQAAHVPSTTGDILLGCRDVRGYQQHQPPQDYGRGGPPHMAFSQSAPRQRTAIACRYCRRRKIRCSGFEHSPEGRCTNCVRFQQECIFTPVSSQAQAFVPAHTVFPGMRNVVLGPNGRAVYPPETQIYGAHGQPLGSVRTTLAQVPPTVQYEYPVQSPSVSYSNGGGPGPAHRLQDSPYGSHNRGPPPPRPQETAYGSYDQGQPSRDVPYGPHERAAPSRDMTYVSHERGQPSNGYELSYSPRDRVSPSSSNSSRKRPREEPHTAILPPPMPTHSPYARTDVMGRRQATEDELRLPPVTPTGAYTNSPDSSGESQSNLYAPGGLPSMSLTPPPRNSSGEGRSDPMSLGNIMERRAPESEIDRSMLGRLGRK
ncbi:hypothetical protein BJ875DRAFT_147884 [Amylocarpus encephaloides]|uniref:Zn(2)-C6 fungal-type domain-containing protein n=1 Tax=Amylocarpus encephaloides TaxID=45428 RepID=A0A9P7YTE6_9HELO|nr:hypothetical protein BJ875DRAFT_147884 [Amylocarpus encephaloides]